MSEPIKSLQNVVLLKQKAHEYLFEVASVLLEVVVNIDEPED